MTGIYYLEATKELHECARTKLSIGCPKNQKQFSFLKTHLQESRIVFHSVWMSPSLLTSTWKVRKTLFKTNKFLIKNHSEMEFCMINCCIKLHITSIKCNGTSFPNTEEKGLTLKNSLLWKKNHCTNFCWNKYTLHTNQELHNMIISISS